MFKVSSKQKEGSVRFDSLFKGQTFKYGGLPDIFMKITDYENNANKSIRCINLITGSIDFISYDTLVTKIDCELVVYQ